MAAPIRLLFVLVTVVFLVCGLIDVLYKFEDNHCEMTWMYQLPEYHPIQLNKKFQGMFPRYGLYFYGEGGYVREMKRTKYKLTGVPVLFIPGNSGSYKQVRSLGSVAQRKAESMNDFIQFNYFSVDLNEELSGVFGTALYKQTEYVQYCIRKILSLYKSASNPPKSVILVGHSMGGMVARALFTLPTFDHSTVSTIITQSTPHQGLVLMYDYHVAKFYREVNSYWKKHMNTKLKDVTVISTGGGFRDFQVRQDLCSLEGLVGKDVSVSTSSMSVPKAWVSTDHLCAVWCRQMVLVTQRALFDTVNRSTLQASTDARNKMNVFQYHFLENQGSREYLPVWEEKVEIIKPAIWKPISSKHWSIVEEVRKKFVYLTVPVGKDEELVAVTNAKVDNWIFACNIESGKKECKETINFSHMGRVIPPLYSNKRVIQLERAHLKDFSHVVFVLPRGEDKAVVTGEVTSLKDLYMRYKVPGMKDILSSFPGSLLDKKEIVRFQGDNSVYRVISLDGLYSVFHTFSVHLESEGCKNSTDEYEGSVMQFHLPGSYDDTYTFIKQGFSGQLVIKRQSILASKNKHSKPELRLYLQPACHYRLSIKFEISDFVGQFFRFYGPLLSAYIVSNILMAFLGQLRCLGKYSICPSFLQSLAKTSRPYFVVPIAEGLRFLMRWPAVTKFILPFHFPEDDSIPLRSLGVWTFALSFILYIMALGFVTFHAYVLDMFFTITGKVLCKVCCCPNFCSRLLKLLKYVLLISAICVSGFICGSLGIVLCYCIQLLKLFRLRCVHEHSTNNQSASLFNFHFSIFLILMWLFVFEAVPLLVWAKQINFSYKLDEDPSRLVGLLCSVAYLIISKWDKPAPVKGMYTSVSVMLYIEVILLILFAIYSQYRIAYVLVAAMLSLIVPQIVSNKIYKLDLLDSVEQKTKVE